MEEALQQFAERLAGVESALMQDGTARLSAEAGLQSLRVQVTQTSVPQTVDHDALAASLAQAVVAAQTASRTEPLDSRAFSKPDKFRSERSRGHDWAAVLQSYISHTDVTGERKDHRATHVAVINPDSMAWSKSSHIMLTLLTSS